VRNDRFGKYPIFSNVSLETWKHGNMDNKALPGSFGSLVSGREYDLVKEG